MEFGTNGLLSAAINSFQQTENSIQEAIRKAANRLTLPKGTLLLTQGDVSDKVYFVERGLVRSFYYEADREITSWLVIEGSFIWQLSSYLLQKPSQENIQLLEPSTIVVLTRPQIKELKIRYDEVVSLESIIMERYLTFYEERIRLLLIPKAEDRLELFIQIRPELYRRTPLRYIASYLGIDPSYLSRLRSKYRF